MNIHALIIDDDPAIRETLTDRLESLGHTFDQAASQEEGEELLREKRFDYVLLDLELPLRRGRPASLEAGKNLLRDAIANPLIQRVGFIVVTAFGHDTPDLAVEVMKIGAVDFVRKPYHGLENAIRDFLKRRTNPQPPITNGRPRDFAGGEMVFLSDRVELNGVEICGDGGEGIMRGILEQLAHRDTDGAFVRLPAKILADRFGEDKTHSVAVAIKRFRERVTRLMKAGGVLIGLEDVIVTRQGGAGYQLAPSLTVRAEVAVAAPGHENRKEATAEDRQKWFVSQLRKGRSLRRADIEEQFGISLATAKRDLIALQPWVSFDRAESAYRLRKSTPRA